MVSNNAWPLRLPRRCFGGVPYTRVAYSSSTLGPVGWLARHGRRGAIPLEARRMADATRTVFDHFEAWLRIDEKGDRYLNDRILVGHPYRFDEQDREALARAAALFDFAWSVSPPGASWYAPTTWLVLAHPRHLLPIPAPAELDEPRRGLVRRALRTDEFATTVAIERTAEEARRLAKRQYNKARYAARKMAPMSLGEALADPVRAMARLSKK